MEDPPRASTLIAASVQLACSGAPAPVAGVMLSCLPGTIAQMVRKDENQDDRAVAASEESASEELDEKCEECEGMPAELCTQCGNVVCA